MRVAHEFVTWVESHGHTLHTVSQDLIDNWLAHGTTREREVRPFLHWANQRGLTRGVGAPARVPTLPVAFITEEEQLDSSTVASPTTPSPSTFVPVGASCCFTGST